MPPPRFSQRIHAQLLLCFPTQGRRIVFLFDSSPPQCVPIHLSPGPYIALCCPEHCRPPSSSQRCPSRPCVAFAHRCLAKPIIAPALLLRSSQCPAPCLTKQCQAVTRRCPAAYHNAFSDLPLSLHPSRRTHRRRPDQGCAASVLSKSRLLCALALPTRSMLCPGFTLHIRTFRNSGTA